MWAQRGISESQRADSLMQAADDWLRLLQVNHPDYQFFTSHGTYYRWKSENVMQLDSLYLPQIINLVSDMLKLGQMPLDGVYMI